MNTGNFYVCDLQVGGGCMIALVVPLRTVYITLPFLA